MTNFWTSAFWRDLNEGDINFRDNLQFELKSLFPIHQEIKDNLFKQEFFMFIPDTLQIDQYSYLKEFFYMDQTNLIRYQTPVFSLKELVNSENETSPINKLNHLLSIPQNKNTKKSIIDEMQLLASIYRSALRKRVRNLVLDLQKHHDEELIQNSSLLVSDIQGFRDTFSTVKKEYYETIEDKEILQHLAHIDEYLVDSTEYYLTGYLDRLKHYQVENNQDIIEMITNIDLYRQEYELAPNKKKDPIDYQESILHRHSLLNKFVMEALKLNTNRVALQEKYGQALGAIAAGIAMFVYMTLFAITLFAWESPPFVFTSFPIILIAVVLYILKDRLKEGLKVIYKQHAFKWFPDYTTKIESPKGYTLGMLKEFFAFIRKKDLPDGFLQMRNEQFHDDLPDLKRHESIIEYKREVHLYPHPDEKDTRRSDLNTIFRFNVQRFIEKANDSLQTYLKLDPKSLKLIHERLPKVYHLNIIIRNTYRSIDGEKTVEVDKFRVVIDKTGIKRVEKL